MVLFGYSKLCTVPYTLYNVPCTMYTIQCTMCTVHYALYRTVCSRVGPCVHCVELREHYRGSTGRLLDGLNVRCIKGALRYTALHYTTLNYTKMYCTELHCTALHCTALHYTKIHYTKLN